MMSDGAAAIVTLAVYMFFAVIGCYAATRPLSSSPEPPPLAGSGLANIRNQPYDWSKE